MADRSRATRGDEHHGPSDSKPAPEWYRDGLRFECTLCGNCCTGPEGVVWFTPEEGRAICEVTGIAEGDLYRDFAHRVGNRWSLREKVLEDGRRDCIFLDRVSMPGKAVCGIYRARPAQCRTWPFWRENLTSRRAWDGAKRRTPCPGMDAGPLVPLERIRILRDATPD